MERYTTDSKRKINIEETDKGLILREASFEPSHIFECGQCFNFHKEEDGSYTAVFLGKIINVLKLDEGVSLIRNISLEDFNEIFYDYFDLGLDYDAIKKEVAIDPVMEKATAYGYGIRILNQEVFETTISFIISANNQIPRIKKAVRIISERYGDYIGEYKGRKYYSFPRPEVLMKVKPEDLREYARVGFRDKRIVEASRMIYEGQLDGASKLDTEDLRKKLMELPGVGPKVADCILLFAYHRRETFPVDVWIKRVMETLFIKKEVPKKQVDDYARKYFGKNAGYAQQYLFYYGREEKIGK
ncbi:DNA-3-methyladenine glycosylase [Anaerococcus prevotii]|uniref:DNA-(apurinic or apyrimidinic site) lyase n=1 Tax=Anaerococcus prevotii (strain ATCC 9321 / DSM 20548 / JCM 6508 / NCTC 11806 / PC1) TaxID=525919 RepID=C7RDZ5_ANAPD|nr:DNA glycosylase [Anaerococcus prevotii]ACV29408.1 8-oxoguanine DNA glycosylase domain protein [Anaerococcus prevotii DSM 20548]SUU95080.1 DNA-3-methyladenine glycosylase [Anaerococcus prevotii]